MNLEITTSAVKAAPPVVVTAASIAGVPVSEVAYALTAIYTLCMLVHFVATKWVIPLFRHRRKRRRRRSSAP